jgi:hypothetical protein
MDWFEKLTGFHETSYEDTRYQATRSMLRRT